MPFPKTLDELRAAGYRFEEHAPCRGCHQVIEWWRTPSLKLIPMDVTDGGAVQTHFASCPNANEFRKARA